MNSTGQSCCDEQSARVNVKYVRTFDGVPKSWNRLDVLEQGKGEAVDFLLVLHDEEGVVCFRNESSASFKIVVVSLVKRTDITEKLDRRPMTETIRIGTRNDAFDLIATYSTRQ